MLLLFTLMDTNILFDARTFFCEKNLMKKQKIFGFFSDHCSCHAGLIWFIVGKLTLIISFLIIQAENVSRHLLDLFSEVATEYAT